MSYCLGFANKFYTLWDVTKESKETPWGHREITHHVYIKNVSMDLEKAKTAYPSAPLDMTLKGSSSWDSYDGEKMPDTKFAYGKYCGMDIADCNDISYLAYIFHTGMFWGEGRKIVVKKLEDAGYHFLDAENSDLFQDPETYARCQYEKEQVKMWKTRFETDGYLDVEMTGNLDMMGVWSRDGLELHFKDYVEMDYAGYHYGLPAVMTKNGLKGKRVKGKTVRIWSDDTVLREEFGWSCFWVGVTKFEILK